MQHMLTASISMVTYETLIFMSELQIVDNQLIEEGPERRGETRDESCNFQLLHIYFIILNSVDI